MESHHPAFELIESQKTKSCRRPKNTRQKIVENHTSPQTNYFNCIVNSKPRKSNQYTHQTKTIQEPTNNNGIDINAQRQISVELNGEIYTMFYSVLFYTSVCYTNIYVVPSSRASSAIYVRLQCVYRQATS